ncbi:hypothetical protein JD844_004864 [Phrynosoma platyrhinos]|uniref:Uncharacterized protein n=1 Tax=Phrynosoma platyrhinos TaxID=52577 RepID=A0ABQ7SDV7_PHRPL|nr:hypothetical protein JD844_004864 [Phrynosoma platyrhinos]
MRAEETEPNRSGGWFRGRRDEPREPPLSWSPGTPRQPRLASSASPNAGASPKAAYRRSIRTILSTTAGLQSERLDAIGKKEEMRKESKQAQRWAFQ